MLFSFFFLSRFLAALGRPTVGNSSRGRSRFKNSAFQGRWRLRAVWSLLVSRNGARSEAMRCRGSVCVRDVMRVRL